MKIISETLSPDNRSKKIGDSEYIICRNNGPWYIVEKYQTEENKVMAFSDSTNDLQEILNEFNGIDRERYYVGT